MCETAQKVARQIRIVCVTTLGANTSVPCADAGGSNNQPHNDVFRHPMTRRNL